MTSKSTRLVQEKNIYSNNQKGQQVISTWNSYYRSWGSGGGGRGIPNDWSVGRSPRSMPKLTMKLKTFIPMEERLRVSG